MEILPPGVPGELHAAKTGTPCEKFPQILPSSRSFAAEKLTLAGVVILILYQKGRISANGMESGGTSCAAFITLVDPDSPDYILGKGRISDNGVEMEILPRLSWLGPREGYTKYLASSLNLFQWRMRTSCQAGCVVPLYY